ncbi:MAG: hypothetical protein M3130_02140 [Actinomycetota bacterium]|nr:hypothetical protein [Actinomycetota bacterium]
MSAAEQSAQERARMQKEISRQLRRWTPRSFAGWALIVFAALMAFNHVLMHLGIVWLPMSTGWQDLFVGWPMAGVLALIGAVLLGAKPSDKSGRS